MTLQTIADTMWNDGTPVNGALHLSAVDGAGDGATPPYTWPIASPLGSFVLGSGDWTKAGVSHLVEDPTSASQLRALRDQYLADRSAQPGLYTSWDGLKVTDQDEHRLHLPARCDSLRRRTGPVEVPGSHAAPPDSDRCRRRARHRDALAGDAQTTSHGAARVHRLRAARAADDTGAPAPVVGETTAEAPKAPRPQSEVERALGPPRWHPRPDKEWQGMLVNLNVQPPCDAPGLCGSALACKNGRCAPCEFDAECAPGESCVLDHCLLSANVRCRHTAECEPRSTCVLSGYSSGARGNADMRAIASRAERHEPIAAGARIASGKKSSSSAARR